MRGLDNPAPGEGLVSGGAYGTARLATVATLAMGCVALLMLGVQPVVLEALHAAGRLSIAQMTQSATIEMIALGATAGVLAGTTPARHLRWWGVLGCVALALANALCLDARGLTFVLCRGLAGIGGGVVVWIAAGVITRSRSAVRLQAIFLAAQALTQATLAAALPFLAPAFAANAGPTALALLSLGATPLVLLIPARLADLPRPEAGHGPLSIQGILGLLATFLLMSGITGLWVFMDALAKADRIAPSLGAFTVALSLVMQMVGAMTVAAIGHRLRPGLALVIVCVLDILVVCAFGVQGDDRIFLGATIVFGFLFTFSLPLIMPLLFEVDPTRRAALLTSGAQLLGGGVGPQLTGLFATDADTRPVLLSAAILFAATLICVLLALARPRALR